MLLGWEVGIEGKDIERHHRAFKCLGLIVFAVMRGDNKGTGNIFDASQEDE